MPKPAAIVRDSEEIARRFRRIHAERHAEGKRFGGAKKPWPNCPICKRERKES